MKRSIKLNMAMVIFAGILAEGLAIRNGDAGRRGIGAPLQCSGGRERSAAPFRR